MTTTTDYVAQESIEDGVHIEIFKAAGIDSSPEAREEAFQIANSLGLDKQQEAYKSEQGMMEWPIATGEMLGILCVCFQENSELNEYEGAIPLSVMREIERLRNFCDAADSDYTLHEVVIRSPQEAASPDPVMFARIGRRGDSEWSAKWHIVARWGSALLPIDELREIAKQTAVSSLISIRNKIEMEIKTIQESPRPMFTCEPTKYSFASPLYSDFRSNLA